MSREEQIIEHIKNCYGWYSPTIGNDGDPLTDIVLHILSWANSNPNWHYGSIPPIEDSDQRKLVVLKTGFITIAEYLPNSDSWYSLEIGLDIHKKDVICWIDLPESPLKN